jgi:integrase
MAKRKHRRWRERVGPYGNSYTIYEGRIGGPVYVATLDRTASERANHSRYRKTRLRYPPAVRRPDGTIDDGLVNAAMKEAKLAYQDLLDRDVNRPEPARTLRELFDRWLAKAEADGRPDAYAKGERRLVDVWIAVLGPRRDPASIVVDDLTRFKADRAAGVIDARGNRVARVPDRRPIGKRAVEGDVVWLVRRLRWAVKNFHLRRHALPDDDVRTVVKTLRERRPRKPRAGEDRYRRTLAKAPEVTFTVRRKKVRSYLREFLTLVHETGARVGAALALRVGDLDLDAGEHGAINWPGGQGEHTKEHAHTQPLTADARAAIAQQLTRRFELFGPDAAAESPWLWPSPRSPVTAAWGYTGAAKALFAAEHLAGLPKLDRGAWHPYRRKWTTERRHHADVDVAAAAGRRDVDVMRESYQGADPKLQQRVMDDRVPIAEDGDV